MVRILVLWGIFCATGSNETTAKEPRTIENSRLFGVEIRGPEAGFSLTNRAIHAPSPYRDGRPAAALRMDARDHGVVLRHGGGPEDCDSLGARDVWVYEAGGVYYMHYDAAGPTGWLCALAVSRDGLNWMKRGPVLSLGAPGEDDAKSASYGITFFDGDAWHMYYMGTPNTTSPPARVPMFPYLTMKARSAGPGGPWVKQKDVMPFRPKLDTYYSDTASPGYVLRHEGTYLQFFSASVTKQGTKRTLGIARTKDLDGRWNVDPNPIVPLEEQIENSSLYFEKSIQTWFLFTNHVGIEDGEFTDAIWVYWSKHPEHWRAEDKAVVLDGKNCTWSEKCIGLPSVLPLGRHLAIYYDAPGGTSTSHMGRDIGLAWLDLPLKIPAKD